MFVLFQFSGMPMYGSIIDEDLEQRCRYQLLKNMSVAVTEVSLCPFDCSSNGQCDSGM